MKKLGIISPPSPIVAGRMYLAPCDAPTDADACFLVRPGESMGEPPPGAPPSMFSAGAMFQSSGPLGAVLMSVVCPVNQPIAGDFGGEDMPPFTGPPNEDGQWYAVVRADGDAPFAVALVG